MGILSRLKLYFSRAETPPLRRLSDSQLNKIQTAIIMEEEEKLKPIAISSDPQPQVTDYKAPIPSMISSYSLDIKHDFKSERSFIKSVSSSNIITVITFAKDNSWVNVGKGSPIPLSQVIHKKNLQWEVKGLMTLHPALFLMNEYPQLRDVDGFFGVYYRGVSLKDGSITRIHEEDGAFKVVKGAILI